MMYPPPSVGGMPPVYDRYPNLLQREQEKRQIALRGLAIGLAIIGMQVLPWILSFLSTGLFRAAGWIHYSAALSQYGGMQPAAYYLNYAVMYLLMVIVPFWILMPCFHLRFGQVMPFRRTARPGWLVLAGAGGLAICMGANLLATRFASVMEGLGISTDMGSLPNDGSVLSGICYFIIIAVLPAFAEEFAFRGVVLQLLRPYGTVLAVVGSAFAFGIMHGTLIQIPFAFAGGLFFGYIVVRTGSIWPSVLLHFLNNALSVVQEEIMSAESRFRYQETATILIYVLFIAATLAGLLCLAALLKRDRNFFRTGGGAKTLLSDKEKFTAYVCNVGMILAMVVIALNVLLTVVYTGLT